MYILVGNNEGFTIKDAELSDAVQAFFSEINFNVNNLEKDLGKITFDFQTQFYKGCDGLTKVAIGADHRYVVGDELSFSVIKRQFIKFAEALKKAEIKTVNDIFFLFVCYFKNVT